MQVKLLSQDQREIAGEMKSLTILGALLVLTIQAHALDQSPNEAAYLV